MRGVAGTVVHPGDLQHDQANAAGSAVALVGDQFVVDQVVGGQAGVVPAGHDAVFQTFAADLQGLEQVWEGGLHTGGSGTVLLFFYQSVAIVKNQLVFLLASV